MSRSARETRERVGALGFVEEMFGERFDRLNGLPRVRPAGRDLDLVSPKYAKCRHARQASSRHLLRRLW